LAEIEEGSLHYAARRAELRREGENRAAPVGMTVGGAGEVRRGRENRAAPVGMTSDAVGGALTEGKGIECAEK